MFWTNFWIDVFLVVLIVTCPLMCLVIMMQRSKQEGLGAAFGGGFTESMWGAQTSNVLVKTTVILAAAFFISSLVLARLYSTRAGELEKTSTLQEQLLKPAAPAKNAVVAPVAPLPATNAAGTPVVPTATPLNSSSTHSATTPTSEPAVKPTAKHKPSTK